MLTAPVSAGKTTVVKVLNKYKFRSYLLSDGIKMKLQADGLDISDPRNYKKVGDQLRAENGNSTLSKIGVEALKEYKGLLVFDGARHPDEIQYLKDVYGDQLFILAVDSPFEHRFKRYAEKFKDKGGLTLEQFQKIDSEELDSGFDNGAHVANCMRMADKLILNDSTLEQFESKIEDLLSENFPI